MTHLVTWRELRVLYRTDLSSYFAAREAQSRSVGMVGDPWGTQGAAFLSESPTHCHMRLQHGP